MQSGHTIKGSPVSLPTGCCSHTELTPLPCLLVALLALELEKSALCAIALAAVALGEAGRERRRRRRRSGEERRVGGGGIARGG